MAWIVNHDGFFSVVKKDCKDDELMVRGRVRQDLFNLCDRLGMPHSAVSEYGQSDYRYRVRVKAKTLADYLAATIQGIQYSNFKDSLPHSTPADRKRGRVYMKVWSDLYQLQDTED